MQICLHTCIHALHMLRPDVIMVGDSDSECPATALDPLSPPPSPAPSVVFSPAPASPAGSVVFSPSPLVVYVPPEPPAEAPLLAPSNYWAPDFDHRSLTGLIGLPAPGYPLACRCPPSPPPDAVPSSFPAPPVSPVPSAPPQLWPRPMVGLLHPPSGWGVPKPAASPLPPPPPPPLDPAPQEPIHPSDATALGPFSCIEEMNWFFRGMQ